MCTIPLRPKSKRCASCCRGSNGGRHQLITFQNSVRGGITAGHIEFDDTTYNECKCDMLPFVDFQRWDPVSVFMRITTNHNKKLSHTWPRQNQIWPIRHPLLSQIEWRLFFVFPGKFIAQKENVTPGPHQSGFCRHRFISSRVISTYWLGPPVYSASPW